MYAYVKYVEDDIKAIVPVSLIMDFHPVNCESLPKCTKLTYWRSADGSEADFYKAKVIMIRATKKALIAEMLHRCLEIPDVIEPIEDDKVLGDSRMKLASKDRLKRPEQRPARRMREEDTGSEYSDSDDEVIPKRLFLQAQDENKEQAREIRKLRRELDSERRLCRELQEALLRKQGTHCCSRIEQYTCPSITVQITRAPQMSPVTEGCMQQVPAQGKQLEDGNFSNLTALCPALPSTSHMGDENTNKPAVPIAGQRFSTRDMVPLPVVDDKVVLGDGLSIDSQKFKQMLSASSDSMFCRDVARALWTLEELTGRSVTGAPCRRFLKTGNQARRALTPEKKAAVRTALKEYIRRNRRSEEDSSRLAQVNKHLGNFLSDMNRGK
ncbi:BEN domain-containing protein 5-like [Ornithodoros turicata]|uniref:BEN domain-containing protein 5-like n=1 Tax=Ornithodoros turicata TaxID=34597 RepID=UPI003138E950